MPAGNCSPSWLPCFLNCEMQVPCRAGGGFASLSCHTRYRNLGAFKQDIYFPTALETRV